MTPLKTIVWMMRKALGIDVGDIGHSLRVRRSASAYLSRTFGTPTSQTRALISLWYRPGWLLGGLCNAVFLANSNPTVSGLIISGTGAFGATYENRLMLRNGNATKDYWNLVFRDPTSWYHIVVSFDTTQGTQADRAKCWVNGVEQTKGGSSLGASEAIGFLASGTQTINGNLASYYGDYYLARKVLLDGQCVQQSTAAVSSFGYLNTEINEWVTKSQSAVKAVVDAGGTNSFMLDFDDATSLTTLGYDKSSKGNNWTLNNISLTAGVTYDWMLDVPGNSFAVLTPIQYQRVTTAYSEANLKWSRSSASNGAVSSSIAFSSGKWYAEFTIAGTDGSQRIGIATITSTVFGTSEVPFGGVSTSYAYQADGTKDNNSSAAYGSTFTNTDVIGVAVDMDSNKIWWAKNGVWQASGDPAAGTNSAFTVTAGVYVIGYSGESSAACNANFGQAPLNASASYDSASGGYFRYTPPTGFKALCQSSLIAEGTVIVSGSFTGNASADGPFVWMNGVPKTLTINGNAVTFGTHADKIAGGFKLRTSSSSYNASGSNTWTATIDSNIQNIFKYNNAEGNP